MTFNLKISDHIDEPAKKKHYNRALFTEVAPRYDFATRALSIGRDAAWKRHLIRNLPLLAAPVCLDLACGTGDLAIMLAAKYPDARIIAIDLTPDMIAIAQKSHPPSNVVFRVGDMTSTGLPDASVDLVTGGYALRNAPDLSAALTELRRVLKPGGCGAFLDFSKPRNRFFQSLELFILKCWGGFWGLLLHGNAEVYGYISESLRRYPDREELRRLLTTNGFCEITGIRFFFGIIEVVMFRRT